MTASRTSVLSRNIAIWLSSIILVLSMSTNALSQSQKFAGGTLSWTVSKNSQTYNRFTLNHLVFTDFVFTYQGTSYSVPGSATYVTCTSSYQGQCAGYPVIEPGFFWVPTAGQYLLFDPPIGGAEQQAKSTKHPVQRQDSNQASVDNPAQF